MRSTHISIEMAANSVKVHTHVTCAMLASEMPCVETSEMAANSVKESLLSLLDEPHSLNYFQIAQATDWEAETRALASRKVQFCSKVDIHANANVCRLAAVLV